MIKKIILIIVIPLVLLSQDQKAPIFGGIDDVVNYFKGNWYVTFLSKPERDDSRGGKGSGIGVPIFDGNTIEITNSLKYLKRNYHTKLFLSYDLDDKTYFASLVNDVSYGVAVNGNYLPDKRQFVMSGYSLNYEVDSLKYSLIIDCIRKDKFMVNFYHISPTKTEKILELGYIKE